MITMATPPVGPSGLNLFVTQFDSVPVADGKSALTTGEVHGKTAGDSSAPQSRGDGVDVNFAPAPLTAAPPLAAPPPATTLPDPPAVVNVPVEQNAQAPTAPGVPVFLQDGGGVEAGAETQERPFE